MAEVVEMIQLSPTMEEGILVEWLKSEGDTIGSGDLLAEVETDKATMEMESYYEGVILKILVQAGDSAGVGTAIAIVGEEGEDISELLDELKAKADQPSKEHDEADEDEEAEEADEPDGEESAGDEGTSDKKAQKEQEKDGERADEEESTFSPSTSSDGERVLASPVARKLAEEHDIPLSALDGSGPGGRVVKADVEKAVKDGVPEKSRKPRQGSAQAASEAGAEEIKLSPMRKSIAKNLTAAWKAPAFMLTRTVTMDRAMSFRKRLNEQLEANDEGKVSVNDIIIKACAIALRDVPEMNASFEGDHIRLYDQADIGVAVAIEGGLITPIVRAAESLRLRDIAATVREMAERARNKRLKPEEYTGATFSISNLGMFGIEHFTAVLNPPGAGILAVGTVRKEPVFNDAGEVVPAQRMSITLTCDHRAVDGALGARFLDRVAVYLEDPSMMLG